MSNVDPTFQFVEQLTSVQSRLYAFVLSLIGNPDLAADVLQETNRVLWEKRKDFTPGTDFPAWAFAIARNQVRAFRLRIARDRLVFDDELAGHLADRAGQAAGDSFDANLAALNYCLEKLPESQRQMMQARYQDKQSLSEIAARLGRSAESLAVTMHRIRKALQDCVRRRCREDEA